jgi:hypothetical protein
MNSSIGQEHSARKRSIRNVLWMALAVLALSGSGCAGGGEGDRCNPFFSHNDCNDPLVCTSFTLPGTMTACGESYCCPANGLSSNANCSTPPPGCVVDSGGSGDDGGGDAQTGTDGRSE